jgi:hypothetical protein
MDVNFRVIQLLHVRFHESFLLFIILEFILGSVLISHLFLSHSLFIPMFFFYFLFLSLSVFFLILLSSLL